MVLLHSHRKALDQPTFLAEATGDSGYGAVVRKGTDDFLSSKGVATEEGLATFAGDRIEIEAKGFVTTHHAEPPFFGHF